MTIDDELELNTPTQWKKALDEQLPTRRSMADPIPAFFFAHGHPGIVFRREGSSRRGLQTVGGPLHQFLKDFGPTLLKKYDPKAIVIFSAHWESPSNQIIVTDYGADQPLLYDYYGFPTEFYQAKWYSNGSTEVSDQIIKCLKAAGLDARKTKRDEPRGQDGLIGPAPGLDHGVFIPFMLMFPEGNEKPFHIPVVQVSIDGSLDPRKNIRLGHALSSLRQGILILSGGLTIHTFERFTEWEFDSASEPVKEFEREIIKASLEKNTENRLERLVQLTKLPGLRIAHPREEHFIPIYIAAGAGSDEGETKVLTDMHGCKTIAFGVV